MSDSVGNVKFQIEAMLAPWDDPEQCVLDIRGKVRVVKGPGDELVQVGKLRALVVRAGEAENLGFGIAMAADAHHQWLANAYGAVFQDGEVRPELGIEPVRQDFIYLERIAIKRRYRRRGVAAQAIRSLIATFNASLLIADSDLELSSAERLSLGVRPAADADHVFIDASRPWPGEKNQSE